MTRKIFLIIFVIFFFKISLCFARFNYSHVLRRTFSDFTSTNSIKKVYVAISPRPEDKDNYVTVSVDNYVKGVVYRELKRWAVDTSYISGFAAQAVAARTYLANKIVTSRVTNVNDSTVQVPNGEGFQVYEYLENYPDPIDSALVLAEGTILAYYDGDGKTLIPIDALYGGKFETKFTKDSENCGLNYQPYLRSVENYENEEIIGGTLTSQKCGMSQIGALSYALEGINYETILDHYYGPTPPTVIYLQLVKVEGNSSTVSFVYEAGNYNNVETDTTREIKILTDGYLNHFRKDLEILLGFDEIVGSTFESTTSVNSIHVWLIGNNILKEFSENKRFWRIQNLNYAIKNGWAGRIPKDNLKDLPDGEYTIKISATHFQGGFALDTTVETKAYKKNFEAEFFGYDSGSDIKHKMKVDVTAPQLTNMLPPEDCYSREKFPNFSAYITDNYSGVDTASLKITIDSTTYTYADGMTYDTATSKLSFTPTIPISEGRHIWGIFYMDYAGAGK